MLVSLVPDKKRRKWVADAKKTIQDTTDFSQGRKTKKTRENSPLMMRSVFAWFVLGYTPTAGPRRHCFHVLSAKTGLVKIHVFVTGFINYDSSITL